MEAGDCTADAFAPLPTFRRQLPAFSREMLRMWRPRRRSAWLSRRRDDRKEYLRAVEAGGVSEAQAPSSRMARSTIAMLGMPEPPCVQRLVAR